MTQNEREYREDYLLAGTKILTSFLDLSPDEQAALKWMTQGAAQAHPPW